MPAAVNIDAFNSRLGAVARHRARTPRATHSSRLASAGACFLPSPCHPILGVTGIRGVTHRSRAPELGHEMFSKGLRAAFESSLIRSNVADQRLPDGRSLTAARPPGSPGP